jgi:hypothetical protein
MWATLAPTSLNLRADVLVDQLGFVSAAVMRVACGISVGMGIRVLNLVSGQGSSKEYNKSF